MGYKVRMTRVGLVLGAGGLVGQAYHAGVLAALENDLGWDPRTADVIVGSSAGSLTGTALRLDISAGDLAAWTAAERSSPESGPLLQALDDTGPIPPFDPRTMLRGWHLPSPALIVRAARRPWAFRPGVAAITLLPSGAVDITARADLVAPLLGDAWPEGLWICAARRDSGARTTFGRPGAPPAPLGRAVAASCAIPGYFAPVRIGDVEYIDGGVHSPTNADVLRTEGLDLVIVVSPMSAAHGRARTADAAMRWAAHRRLQREVNRLRATGTEVVRFEPTPRVLAAMGLNAMAEDRARDVVNQSFLAAGAYAATDRVASRLGVLASRPSRPTRPTRRTAA
ncbi:MAG: Patatin [Acidimicrobiales bacterium]|nr:Patatin [Acidimicrobiales bacterium]